MAVLLGDDDEGDGFVFNGSVFVGKRWRPFLGKQFY